MHSGAIVLDDGWRFEPQWKRERLDVSHDDHVSVWGNQSEGTYSAYLVREINGPANSLGLIFHFSAQDLTRVECLDNHEPGIQSEPTAESEVESQAAFLAFLEASFGKPHSVKRTSTANEEFPLLNRYFRWTFDWGSAWCGVHPKDGYVSAGVGYMCETSTFTPDAWSLRGLFRRLRL